MHRFLQYAVFLVVLLLLQSFLFHNLNLGVFIHPLTYIAFIILLPMELLPVAVLFLGLLLGVSIDYMTGTAGLNTIATLATAYLRRPVLTLMVGKENIADGGVPSFDRLGFGKFLRYSTVMVVLHCLIFFTFETLNFRYYYITVLKVVLSSAVTVVLVYFCQFLLPATHGKKTDI